MFSLIGKSLPLILLCGTFASAKSTVEGAQLDYVALDAGVECNRILFQSSQNFKRTLFVVPRVVQGNGIEGARNYLIRPTAEAGHYTLTVDLFFPGNEVTKSNYASTYKKDVAACNWDEVKASLNKSITDPSAKIDTIASIPLTSVEMRIPGISAVGIVGRNLTTSEEVDILDYHGKSLSVRFEITEQEKRAFQAQLVTTTGISANVKFRFQARSRNGSVHAKVNTTAVLNNFSAAVAAKGLRYLSAIELTAALQSAFAQNTIQVTAEGGTTEQPAKIAAMLIEKIVKDINFSAELPEKDKEKASAPKGGLVSVAAAMELIKSKVSSDFAYQIMTSPESATAQTEVKLYADRLNDPNVTEIPLKAGYGDPSTGIELKKGFTISVTPAYWYLDKITYKESRKYITMSDITSLKLGGHFTDIVSDKMTIENVEINHTLLAQGIWRPYANSPLVSPYRYRWVRITKEAVRSRQASDVFTSDLEELRALPIYLTFSGLGDTRLIKLTDLFQENPYWRAQHDPMTGQIFLTALQNLGTIRFRQRMRDEASEKSADKPEVLDQVQQLRMPLAGKPVVQGVAELVKDPTPLILQKTVVLYVSRPEFVPPGAKPVGIGTAADAMKDDLN